MASGYFSVYAGSSSVRNQSAEKRTERVTGTLDWISNLPDIVLVQVLSLLPTKDAFITRLVSERCQYLWTSVDCLYFCFPYDLNLKNFISFVDYAFIALFQKLKYFISMLTCVDMISKSADGLILLWITKWKMLLYSSSDGIYKLLQMHMHLLVIDKFEFGALCIR